MKKNSKHLFKEVEDFFESAPSPNQKAWGVINDFYNLILHHMQKQGIKKTDLAERLGKSRSAISQMLNGTPNISIKKMVEIADAIGIDINISSPQVSNYSHRPLQELTCRLDETKWISEITEGVPVRSEKVLVRGYSRKYLTVSNAPKYSERLTN